MANIIDYPNELNIIFDKLNKLNVKPVIVGGYVRDFLLKIDSKDVDVELYGVSTLEKLEKILEEFGEVNSVGKSFGVCKLNFRNFNLDFSLPRVDKKISSGHKGFSVQTCSNFDFETAARRRDFTINSIGYDALEKKILDPFNGMVDLEKKLLRAVDEKSFVEDPLRILRAVRFSSRLNFALCDNLFFLCKKMIREGMLNELSKERVFDEIKKIFLKSPSVSLAFNLLKELGALEYFNELTTLTTSEWEETLNALDEINLQKFTNEKTNVIIMLSITCYRLDSSMATLFVGRLTNDKEILKKVLALLENRMADNMSNTGIYKLAQFVNMEEAVTLNLAFYPKNRLYHQTLLVRAKKLNVLNKKLTAILEGKDLIQLGLDPSPKFSKLLQKAYLAQMEGSFKNKEEALLWLKGELRS